MNTDTNLSKRNITVRLDTERLVVRDFVEADCQDVYAYGSDPEVVRFMPFGPSTQEQTLEHVRRCMLSAQETPRLMYDLGIELRAEGRIIGGCTLALENDWSAEAAFSYLLNRRYWGQGYMTEAVHALFSFGFETLRLHRITDTIDPENVASIRVMERLGVHCEGHLKESCHHKGEWRDELVYAVLDHEWRSR